MGSSGQPPAPEAKKKIALCPECETEVNLAEGDECQKCGLDVAWCLEKLRRERAVEKLRAQQTAATKPAEKKKKLFSLE